MEELNVSDELLETNLLQIRLAEKLFIPLEEFTRDYSEVFRQLWNIRKGLLAKGRNVPISSFEESSFTMCTLYKQRFLTKRRVHGVLEEFDGFSS